MEGKKPDTVKEPDLEYTNHSYADYLTWQMEEVVELIKEKIFKKAVAIPKGIRESQTQYRLMNQDYYRRNLLPAMLGWFSMNAQTSIEDTEWLPGSGSRF
ncbi:MAG: hypothetical protein R6V72_21730 [Cyclobacterium sp.]|uniref:hypothetical protein n=1 Tax=unclassified Cyclobacterium TaxID=2615055 RepID=UPI00196A11FA|nr:hypothetical protein [Cyclobacterium sp. SYSU L10401]